MLHYDGTGVLGSGVTVPTVGLFVGVVVVVVVVGLGLDVGAGGLDVVLSMIGAD